VLNFWILVLLYTLPNTLRIIKSWRMRWVGKVNVYKILYAYQKT